MLTTSTKLIGGGLIGAALLLCVGWAVSFTAFNQLEDAALARDETYAVIDGANQLLSDLKDAETGTRGYLLTNDEAFLAPYLDVRDRVPGDLGALRSLKPGDAHLDALVPLVEQKLAYFETNIALAHGNEMPAALERVRGPEGMPLMEDIRAEVRAFIDGEASVLATHEAAVQVNMARLFVSLVVASLFMFLLALASTILVYRDSQRRLDTFLLLETKRSLEAQEASNHLLQGANATLQASEEKLSVTLNSIGDAVIATDADGRVTVLNPRAEELTGWPQAEAAGRLMDDIFHIINQETREPSTIPVKETLANGTIQGLANHTVLIARDGSERAIADSCAPIRDRTGKVTGAVLVFRDVTEEYAVQKALRDQHFYNRSLIESHIDAMITTDPLGTITDANRQMETLTGCPRSELLGRPFSTFFVDTERADEGIAAVLQRQTLRDYELTARGPGGQETDVSYNATTFYDRDGKLKGVVATARDVTERHRIDQALLDQNVELGNARSVAEKANLAKSEFLSSMSHELRSPLNAILGFAQLMESDVPPPPPSQMEGIEQILKAGWHLLTLINEVLDLAKVESGQVPMSLEPVSLSDLLRECHAMIDPQARQRGIQLNFPILASPHFVRADRTRVKQILINLLSNAIKYNTKGGSVDIRCEDRPHGRVRVDIADTGAGLSVSQLQQLFQAFNRLGQEAGGEEGTGIGLVVARRLVELMGGSIHVTSKVGAGSVFGIELDGDVAPELIGDAHVESLLAAHRTATGTRQDTVLYVEDNPANLLLVTKIIARLPNIHLVTATLGCRGVEIARETRPDVILMDINLPDISGFEAMKLLRANPLTAHIPVVAVSANAMPRDIERGSKDGFFRYITKPINVADFVQALTMALDSARTRTPPRD